MGEAETGARLIEYALVAQLGIVNIVAGSRPRNRGVLSRAYAIHGNDEEVLAHLCSYGSTV